MGSSLSIPLTSAQRRLEVLTMDMAIQTTENERLASQLEKSNSRLAQVTIQCARLEDDMFQTRQTMMEENRQLREHKHNTEAVNLQLLEQQQADEEDLQGAQSKLRAVEKEVTALSDQMRAGEEETNRLVTRLQEEEEVNRQLLEQRKAMEEENGLTLEQLQLVGTENQQLLQQQQPLVDENQLLQEQLGNWTDLFADSETWTQAILTNRDLNLEWLADTAELQYLQKIFAFVVDYTGVKNSGSTDTE